MFFLLRCVFWLGIVFYMMDWPGGATPAVTVGAALGDVAHAAASAAATRAAPAVRDLCLAKPAACLTLVTGAPVAAPAPASTSTSVARGTDAPPPLPPRRPRTIIGNG